MLPETLTDRRTGRVYDLDIADATCPECGYGPPRIRRLPEIGSWFSTVEARCTHCGRTYHVRLLDPR